MADQSVEPQRAVQTLPGFAAITTLRQDLGHVGSLVTVALSIPGETNLNQLKSVWVHAVDLLEVPVSESLHVGACAR